MNKKIVVLGWGSLIWCPKNLKIKYAKWKNDGPRLPIEFARKSKDGRLTLVIYDEYLNDKNKWVNVLWNEMDVQSIQEAIGNLCTREETTPKNIGFIYEEMKNKINFDDKNKWCKKIKNFYSYIGGIPHGGYYYNTRRCNNYEGLVVKVIEKWMKEKELDAVVWTDLSSNFTPKEIIEYVRNISCPIIKELITEYVKNTPSQIITPLRKEIERKLGY